jgi:hypothetical protein
MMKQLILAPVLAIAIGAGAPACARTPAAEPILTSNGIIAVLIGLLLPAVQK